jgi:hypothetical protein
MFCKCGWGGRIDNHMELTDELADMAVSALLTSREWRLNNLYVILSEEDGIVPFKARPEQLEFRRNRHNCNLVPKARKLGMSTEIVIENLDACMFNDNYRAAIIDLTEPDAWDKLSIAKLAWEHGPKHPDEGIAEIWQKLHKINPLVLNSNSEMKWTNGSRFEAGISFTGGTLQALHVSELGPIAAQKPNKAAEIRRGSMNAVVQNGFKVIETTMEGGRFGVCYDYFELAVGNANRTDLDRGEWRLHFFPWINHPHYRLPGRKPSNGDTIKYFAELKEKHGLDVPLDRQAWYEMKKRELKDEIWQQFPTILEECIRTTVSGQIYPEIVTLRGKGRVSKEFEPEKGVPLLASWDLGSGENMDGWLFQKGGKDFSYIDWCHGEGLGAAGMAEMIRVWEKLYGPILCNFLPHDADTLDKGSGKTYRTQLIACGVSSRQIRVVPRVKNVWLGIDEVRRRIPRMWFHPRCDEKVTAEDGTKLPGGVGRLEAYRKTPNSSTGKISPAPFPDFCAHTADSIRTGMEADWHGMIDALEYSVGNQGSRVYSRGRNIELHSDQFKVLRGPNFSNMPKFKK